MRMGGDRDRKAGTLARAEQANDHTYINTHVIHAYACRHAHIQNQQHKCMQAGLTAPSHSPGWG